MNESKKEIDMVPFNLKIILAIRVPFLFSGNLLYNSKFMFNTLNTNFLANTDILIFIKFLTMHHTLG